MEKKALVDARAAEAKRHLFLLLLVRLFQRWVHRVLDTLDILHCAAAGNLRLGVAEVPLLRGLHSSTFQLNVSAVDVMGLHFGGVSGMFTRCHGVLGNIQGLFLRQKRLS